MSWAQVSYFKMQDLLFSLDVDKDEPCFISVTFKIPSRLICKPWNITNEEEFGDSWTLKKTLFEPTSIGWTPRIKIKNIFNPVHSIQGNIDFEPSLALPEVPKQLLIQVPYWSDAA